MTIKLVVPDGLAAISNGRLLHKKDTLNNYTAWTWEVKNPINNYGVTMNIGRYVNWTDTLMGEQGKLDLSYWVLDYNIDAAKKHFAQVKPMLRSFEHWFGQYPFYEDGYKLIETPFLGMEHQSAVAYGNKFTNGYLGRDLSGTGWGLKWDFIIIHESGHEWFGNNITTNDIADMWVHEGFTNYSETLYIESQFGKAAAYEYVFGIRKNIRNDKPIIGDYGVNSEGSGDMYYKAANLIHNIRNAMNDDVQFRKMTRGLNATYFHKTVDGSMVEAFISKESGMDLSKVFDQYLRTILIPVLEFYLDKNNKNVQYRYTNCVKGFNLPLVLKSGANSIKVCPTDKWQKTKLTVDQQDLWQADLVEKNFYINVKKVQGKTR
jgi:aminopeptidase N